MWIKIDEKAPKENQKVFFYFEKIGVERGIFRFVYTDQMKIASFYSLNRGWLIEDITHWQPDDGRFVFPEQPTKQELHTCKYCTKQVDPVMCEQCIHGE